MKHLFLALSLSLALIPSAWSAETPALSAPALQSFLNSWQKLPIQEPGVLEHYQATSGAMPLKLVCAQNGERAMQITGAEVLEQTSQADKQTYRVKLQLETEGFPKLKCSENYSLELGKGEHPRTRSQSWVLSSARSETRREWIIKPAQGTDPSQLQSLGKALKTRLSLLSSQVPQHEIKPIAGGFVVTHALSETLPANWQGLLTQPYQLSFRIQSEDGKSWQDTGLSNQHIQSSKAVLISSGEDPDGIADLFSSKVTVVPIWSIEGQMTPEGTQKFAKITTAAVGKPLGIFLDEKPLYIPVINAPITDGSFLMDGTFSGQEAKQLALFMSLPPLPMALTIQGSQIVGP